MSFIFEEQNNSKDCPSIKIRGVGILSSTRTKKNIVFLYSWNVKKILYIYIFLECEENQNMIFLHIRYILDKNQSFFTQ